MSGANSVDYANKRNTDALVEMVSDLHQKFEVMGQIKQMLDSAEERAEAQLNIALTALRDIFRTLDEEKITLGDLVHARKVAYHAIEKVDGKAPDHISPRSN